MKRKALAPVLLVLTLLAAGSPARAQEPVKAELEVPFALASGEKARLESENFEVTLRSMTDDSGCDDPKDCSAILFKGTLLLRHDEKKLVEDFTASFELGKSVHLDFDGYRLELTTVRRPDPKGPSYATFRVVRMEEGEKKE